MRFEYHLKVVSSKSLPLERLTDTAAAALAEAGVLEPGDYVENPNCGTLDYENHPTGNYRARVGA